MFQLALWLAPNAWSITRSYAWFGRFVAICGILRWSCTNLVCCCLANQSWPHAGNYKATHLAFSFSVSVHNLVLTEHVPACLKLCCCADYDSVCGDRPQHQPMDWQGRWEHECSLSNSVSEGENRYCRDAAASVMGVGFWALWGSLQSLRCAAQGPCSVAALTTSSWMQLSGGCTGPKPSCGAAISPELCAAILTHLCALLSSAPRQPLKCVSSQGQQNMWSTAQRAASGDTRSQLCAGCAGCCLRCPTYCSLLRSSAHTVGHLTITALYFCHLVNAWVKAHLQLESGHR